MEKRTAGIFVALLVTMLLIVAAAPAAAAPGDFAPPGYVHEGSIVLDNTAMEQIAELGVVMQTHLTINENGTLALSEVDADQLGVSPEYVENYKASLQYINATIKQGYFTVDEQFQVTWDESLIDGAEAGSPIDAKIETGGYYYHAGHGVYTHFSYSNAYYYIPTYGLSTATSLASYVGYPHYATPYTYHFTYRPTYSYYYYYAYPGHGVWSYVPSSSLSYYHYGYYYPSYQYVYYWNPYGSYYYSTRCYY